MTVQVAEIREQFRTLLPPKRRSADRRKGLDALESPAMGDKARIILSAAFRRLQTKAQVFSLERDASVRTRLTHSLEVAMCGELLAERAFGLLADLGAVDERLRVEFISTVENACLLHDIGNPPFGHLGEYAIQQWFQANGNEIRKRWKQRVPKEQIDRYLVGLREFNGNAQSFRIATQLQWSDGPWGLGLTYGLLGAIVKYLTSQTGSSGDFTRKIGYFETEASIIREVWGELGLRTKNGVPTQRHPLTFLMEAADDIAYSLSDIEDAFEKRIIDETEFLRNTHDDFDALFHLHPPELTVDEILETPADGEVKYSKFLRLRSAATTALIDAAARVFVSNLEAILAGDWPHELLAGEPTVDRLIARLKAIAKKDIFLSTEAIDVELSGFEIVQRLLDGFMPLLHLDYARIKGLDATGEYHRDDCPLERRLYSLMGKRQLKAYHSQSRDSELDPVFRTHLIVDFVSGMTDSYAVKVFNIMNGTSVGASF